MFLNFNRTKWDRAQGPLPSQLIPLYHSSDGQASLLDVGSKITTEFGFDSFIYGMTTAGSRSNEARFYYCSSAPRAWVAEYDEASYFEIDPRITHAWSKLTPLVWDRTVGSGDKKVEAFLNRAATHGVGSGVCVPMRDEGHARIVVFLNSSDRDVTDIMLEKWTANLGLYVLFTIHFHSIFMQEVVRKNVPPLHRGAPLSKRELECLNLSAKGQTSTDIAFKLNITERTVNFHFSNIVSKLDALNRIEAIAIGVARGLVNL